MQSVISRQLILQVIYIIYNTGNISANNRKKYASYYTDRIIRFVILTPITRGRATIGDRGRVLIYFFKVTISLHILEHVERKKANTYNMLMLPIHDGVFGGVVCATPRHKHRAWVNATHHQKQRTWRCCLVHSIFPYLLTPQLNHTPARTSTSVVAHDLCQLSRFVSHSHLKQLVH